MSCHFIVARRKLFLPYSWCFPQERRFPLTHDFSSYPFSSSWRWDKFPGWGGFWLTFFSWVELIWERSCMQGVWSVSPSPPRPAWSSHPGKCDFAPDSVFPWVGCSKVEQGLSGSRINPTLSLVKVMLGSPSLKSSVYFPIGSKLGQGKVSCWLGFPKAYSPMDKNGKKKSNNAKCSQEIRAKSPFSAADARVNQCTILESNWALLNLKMWIP